MLNTWRLCKYMSPVMSLLIHTLLWLCSAWIAQQNFYCTIISKLCANQDNLRINFYKQPMDSSPLFISAHTFSHGGHFQNFTPEKDTQNWYILLLFLCFIVLSGSTIIKASAAHDHTDIQQKNQCQMELKLKKILKCATLCNMMQSKPILIAVFVLLGC